MKIREYYSKYNPVLVKSLKKQTAYKKWLEKEEKTLMKIIPEKAKVLEIGAGSGRIIDALNNTQRKIFGIDIAEIGSLKEKYINSLWVKVYQMNAEKLKFKDNSFDICTIMSHTLGLFKNPIKVISECYRVTKSKGKVIISTYEKNKQYVLKERVKYFKSIGYNPVVRRFQVNLKDGISAKYFDENKLKEIFCKANLKFNRIPLTRLGCLWIAEVKK